jgi:DNA-binding response OmpR family regulator
LDTLSISKCIKILATNKNEKTSNIFDGVINLPTSVKEINKIVEISLAKKQFLINSSIKIKDYSLDKNEKKLIKNNISLILTEKEIQLLELFLYNKKPISKNKILSMVWNYSSDADTHTVETHIYRLRKKIHEKFSDGHFILNNKEGYHF